MTNRSLHTRAKENTRLKSVNSTKNVEKKGNIKYSDDNHLQIAKFFNGQPSNRFLNNRNIRFLQRTIGNQAVGQMIQAKLRVGEPNDRFEREADQVADKVMRLPNPTVRKQPQEDDELQQRSLANQISPFIQRQESEKEETVQASHLAQRQDEEELQTKELIQRQEAVEEEAVQAKTMLQRQEAEEEEAQPKALLRNQEAEVEEAKRSPLLQRQEEEEELQTKELIQRQETEEEETVQAKTMLQRQEAEEKEETQAEASIQRQETEKEKVEAKSLIQRQEGEEELQAKSLIQCQNEEVQTEELLQAQKGENVQVQMDQEPKKGLTKSQSRRNVALNAVKSKRPGEPLSPLTRMKLESGLGVDLSDVQIHKDLAAQEAAASIKARAFTHKNHIWLGQGQSQDDLRLMAHEVTHVLQQGGIVRRQPQTLLGDREDRGKEPITKKNHTLDADQKHTASIDADKQKILAEGGEDKISAGAVSKVLTEEDKPLLAEGGVVSTESTMAAAEKRPRKESAAAPPAAVSSQTAKPRTASPISQRRGIQRGSGSEGRGGGEARGVPFSGEPSKIIEQLSQVSVAKAPFIFSEFASAVKSSLSARRAEQTANPPHALIRPKVHLAAGRGTAKKVETSEGAPVRSKLPQVQKQAPAVKKPKPHRHSGASAEVRGIENPSSQLDQAEQQGEQTFFARVRSWLRRFISAMPTSDNGVNADPGISPKVDLTGAANPSQIETLRGYGSLRVAKRQATAERERNRDYGENDIAAEAEEEELRAALPQRKEQEHPGCAPAKEVQPLNFDPEDEAELSKRVRIRQAADYGTQEKRFANAEKQRDQRIASAQMEADQSIKARHDASYKEQTDSVRHAQADVLRMRKKWQEQNQAVMKDYDSESGRMGRHTGSQIDIIHRREEREIADRYKKTSDRASKERRRVEAKAQKARSETQRKSGGWLSRGLRWVKNKVKSAFRTVVGKIKKWFADLRARIKKWFDELKAWAINKIEQARRWIVKKLEQFRKYLNGLVDKYLLRYPNIANLFKRGINTTIGIAQKAVNISARVLKIGVSVALDGLAAAFDFALAIPEFLIVESLTFLCGTIVTGFNLLILAVDRDLDAVIELVRDLPEPAILGPLWPIVKGGILGFLERIRREPADRKKKFLKKILRLAISPSYYGGYLLGVLKGIVWDGLVGTLKMLYDIVVGIPKAIMAIFDIFQRLLKDIKAINEILTAAKQVYAELRAFMARPDAAEQVVALLKRTPSILFAMVKEAFKQGRAWARRAGAESAGKLIKFVLVKSPFDIGLELGTIVGQILFEVLLLIFTSGIGTAIKVAGKALQVITRGIRLLTRAIGKGGGLILKALRSIRTVIKAGIDVARRIGGKLKNVFERVQVFVNKVFNWFVRAFSRVRKRIRGLRPGRPKRPPKRKGRPRDRNGAQWLKFVRAVKTKVQPFRKHGIEKKSLKRNLVPLRNRYRSVLALLKPIRIRRSRREAFHVVWARRRGRPTRPITKVLMDRDTRWKEGRKAIRKRLRRIRESDLSTGSLQSIINPYERHYRYSSLRVVWDERENDWNIMAAMSQKKQIAEVDNVKGLHKGTFEDPIPIDWYKRPQDYPLHITLTIGNKRERIPMFSSRDVYWKGERFTIGVARRYRVGKGRKLWQFRKHKRVKKQQRDFRKLIEDKGYRFLPGKQADHVLDLGFGGDNSFRNLWPLKKEINERPYIGKWRLLYRLKYKVSNTEADEKPLNELWGKWFKVKGFNYPPKPNPGGKD